MKTLRTVVFWIVMVLGLTAAAGTLGVQYMLNHTDEFLTAKLRESIQASFPDCRVELGRARFDLQGRIRAYDIRFFARNATNPLLNIGEAVIVVPRDELMNPQPKIAQIRLVNSTLSVAKNLDDEEWNVTCLRPTPTGAPPPEVQLENCQLMVYLENLTTGTPVTTHITNINARLVPEGRHRYTFQLRGRSDIADELFASGDFDLEKKSIRMTGDVSELSIDQKLADLLAAGSPEIQRRLDAAAQRIVQYRMASEAATEALAKSAGQTTPSTVVRQSRPRDDNSQRTTGRIPVLGVSAVSDLKLRVTHTLGDPEPVFTARINFRDGEVDVPAFPYVVHNIQGQVEVDNRELRLKELTAAHGLTRLDATALLKRDLTAGDQSVSLSVVNLELSDQLMSALPLDWRPVYAAFHARGRADAALKLTRTEDAGWKSVVTLIPQRCEAQHDRFPYPVEDVVGQLVFQDSVLTVDLSGRADNRSVALSGQVRNPGPRAEADLYIDVQGVSIDEKLRFACQNYEKLVKTLDLLQARGMVDGRVHIHRDEGPGQSWIPHLTVRLKNVTVLCKSFPYEITNVAGLVEGSLLNWDFKDLRGLHERSVIEASGTLRPDEQGEPQLELGFVVKGAAYDATLRRALIEDRWVNLWSEFNPTGTLNATGQLMWQPGHKPDIQFDELNMVDGSISIRSFPFALNNVRSALSFKDGELEIKSFRAEHGETVIMSQGHGKFFEDGRWMVRLTNFNADALEPDTQFRKALPAQMRTVVDALDPRGTLWLNGWMELRGWPQEKQKFNAAWDMAVVCRNAVVTTGVEVENVHGKVQMEGFWDGIRVDGRGKMEIDSLVIQRHQFTQVRGPFRLNDAELQVGLGSPDAGPPSTTTLDEDPPQAVTARFVDGTVSLNGTADLRGRDTSYKLRLTLTDGRLEQYAQQHLRENRSLAGVMNGHVNIEGQGPEARRVRGSGRLLIRPAALYELPVVVAVFKVLRFLPPDKTAFDEANMVFEIASSNILFRRIDLIGNSISLVGGGNVQFNGNVTLDFLSRTGRSAGPVPGLMELFGELTRGWLGVEVRGTLNSPATKLVPAPQLEQTLRQLFDGMGGAQPARSRPQRRNPLDRLMPKPGPPPPGPPPPGRAAPLGN